MTLPPAASDIAKCHGETADGSRACPYRDECRRYLAPSAGDWQRWVVEPMPAPGEECESYWPWGK